MVAALKLSFGTALAAAMINGVFGLLLAWVLVRYDFPGKCIIDAAVGLPFALPTAVAGIALAAIYSPTGWIGSVAATLGFKIAFTPLGIILALVFVGLPFVVRTVQPVLAKVQQDIEEAATLLGASRWRAMCAGLRKPCRCRLRAYIMTINSRRLLPWPAFWRHLPFSPSS